MTEKPFVSLLPKQGGCEVALYGRSGSMSSKITKIIFLIPQCLPLMTLLTLKTSC